MQWNRGSVNLDDLQRQYVWKLKSWYEIQFYSNIFDNFVFIYIKKKNTIFIFISLFKRKNDLWRFTSRMQWVLKIIKKN